MLFIREETSLKRAPPYSQIGVLKNEVIPFLVSEINLGKNKMESF